MKARKRYYNMNGDERRAERLRRLPLIVRAIRDMPPMDVRALLLAALELDFDDNAKLLRGGQ